MFSGEGLMCVRGNVGLEYSKIRVERNVCR